MNKPHVYVRRLRELITIRIAVQWRAFGRLMLEWMDSSTDELHICIEMLCELWGYC